MYDIITFGSATQDIIINPKKITSLQYNKKIAGGEVCFPLGSKIDVENIAFYSGGGGTNTAATFALQGFKTAFCGMVGNDPSAKEILKELKHLNIETHLVSHTDKKITNHSVVILSGDKEERTIFTYRGAAELVDKNSIPWNKLKTHWLYLAPLTGLLCDTFGDLVHFAHEHKIKVAANPSMAQLSLNSFPEIAKKIDVLILNQEEASFLTKIQFEKEEEIFKKIDGMTPGIVVMTKGGEGTIVSDGTYIYSAKPTPDRVVIDTTGAGDSFASGFISDLIRYNGDIEKAIQLGMANAQGCLSAMGAKNGLLKKGQIFDRISVNKNSTL